MSITMFLENIEKSDTLGYILALTDLEDINATTDELYGHNPLTYCAINGYVEVGIHVLDAGANPEATSDSGVRALTYAMISGSPRLAKALIEQGANVNIRGDRRSTLLHEAATIDDIEITHTLLKYGAEVNAKDLDGSTPLHASLVRARKEGIPAFIDLLVSNGADVHALDNREQNLMHIVGVCGIPELLDILISYNVDINAQDKDGFTPLHLAYMYKEMDTIKKLIERGAKEDIRAKNGKVASETRL